MDNTHAQWLYSTLHKSPCKVIEEQNLWGQTVCRVWLPNQDAVVRVPRETLQAIESQFDSVIERERIRYIAAGAKVADLLESAMSQGQGDTAKSHEQALLAPMESNVTPFPHQLHALSRLIRGDQIRYLLADEVGLGKTIEAGLAIRELKLRGLVRRTLIIAPKGLATQWVEELHQHFNEHFQLILGEDIRSLQRFSYDASSKNNSDTYTAAWTMFDQVIVSLDSIKPMDKRNGWSDERIAAYNRSRFESIISAGWDLVIVDEAHRLGGSSDQVARYKLGKGLAEAAPYLLLLSATPHQGKTDAFHRLMSLLDENAFPTPQSVTRERVAPYIIRTEKRRAITEEGKPLFNARKTQTVPVLWEDRHQQQELFYEAVTDYVREGYNQAVLEQKHHVGFLMILMQRLVASSTRAIRTTLERRISLLQGNKEQISSRLTDLEQSTASEDLESFYDMDGQELLDTLLNQHMSALENEVMHVETLLSAAKQCEQEGADAKAEALLSWIYQLQAEEHDPDLKILVFTEFVPTQTMLQHFLEDRGISVVLINGSMTMAERKQAQEAFRQAHRILISTDAGGEGLNLQFAHIIVNYDIPWNPMRLEQRIGRVDRIGQPKIVRAINLVIENSVEFRVREVLEQKLQVIFKEFGIDKTGDVLDSAEAGSLFDSVFTSALLHPEDIEGSVDTAVATMRHIIEDTRANSPLYALSEQVEHHTAARLRQHPLPHWLENMTIGYVRSHGGEAIQHRSSWDITWPDGIVEKNCSFISTGRQGAKNLDNGNIVNLEDSRVRALALALPQITMGQLVPHVGLDGIPETVVGVWALFEIRLQAGLHRATPLLRIPMVRRSYLALFVSDEGILYLPTARHIWDALQTSELKVFTNHSMSFEFAYNHVQFAAEETGKEIFEVLKSAHTLAIIREKERGNIAFSARYKAIEPIGLPEVKQYRMARCQSDEADWRQELQAAEQAIPEIRPLLFLRFGR